MGADDESEVDRFTEHARWILAYHDARSESFMTRAVALLGFVGVILALLLGGGIPDEVDVDLWVQAPFAVTVVALLAASGFCLATLKARELAVPGVERARKNWREWVSRRRRGSVAIDIAEVYLGAKDLTQESALEQVAGAASDRARCFSMAVTAMGVALCALAALITVVGTRVS